MPLRDCRLTAAAARRAWAAGKSATCGVICTFTVRLGSGPDELAARVRARDGAPAFMCAGIVSISGSVD